MRSPKPVTQPAPALKPGYSVGRLADCHGIHEPYSTEKARRMCERGLHHCAATPHHEEA